MGDWEKKEIIVPADTSGSGITNDNDIGIIVKWWLGAGSTFTGGTFTNNVWEANVNANRVHSSQVNLADSTDNEWYITGVQLEVGSQATPFEHRSFGEELALCQRYYEHDDSEGSDNYRISLNKGTTGESYFFAIDYAVTKRAKPTTTLTQVYSDNIVFSPHSASSSRGHMGVISEASGSTDTRALFECTWTADAEL